MSRKKKNMVNINYVTRLVAAAAANDTNPQVSRRATHREAPSLFKKKYYNNNKREEEEEEKKSNQLT